jgi:hypothetical protein
MRKSQPYAVCLANLFGVAIAAMNLEKPEARNFAISGYYLTRLISD